MLTVLNPGNTCKVRIRPVKKAHQVLELISGRKISVRDGIEDTFAAGGAAVYRWK